MEENDHIPKLYAQSEKCLNGELKCLGRILCTCSLLLFVLLTCSGCCWEPCTNSWQWLWPRVQRQQLLQRVSSTSCNLLKELAFAMLVRCGFRLKGMANWQPARCILQDIGLILVYTCRCLRLQCMERKLSLYCGPLRTQNCAEFKVC